MNYTEQEINDMIDGLLRYCNIEEKLTNKEKLKTLKDIKLNLEIDSDITYDRISNICDKFLIEQGNKRMMSNNMAIKEINACIRYLEEEIKKEKKRKREKCLRFIKQIIN